MIDVRTVLVALALLLCGCGGIDVRVESVPPGAEVLLERVDLTTNPQVTGRRELTPGSGILESLSLGPTPLETTLDLEHGGPWAWQLRIRARGYEDQVRFLQAGDEEIELRVQLKPTLD